MAVADVEEGRSHGVTKAERAELVELRRNLHFIPISSSWLNLVERLFKELTDRRIRRGAFTSVANLIDAVDTWVEHWNDDPKPLIWHKTDEGIITKVRSGRAALTQVKYATHD